MRWSADRTMSESIQDNGILRFDVYGPSWQHCVTLKPGDDELRRHAANQLAQTVPGPQFGGVRVEVARFFGGDEKLFTSHVGFQL